MIEIHTLIPRASNNVRGRQVQQLEPNGVHALFNNAGTNYSEDFETYPVQAGANDCDIDLSLRWQWW